MTLRVTVGRLAARVVAVAACAAAAAPGASAETLIDALARTYQSNPQILGERARLRQSDEQVAQALSNWRPSVTLSGDAGYARARQDIPRSFVNNINVTNPYGGELRVTQNIYRGGITTAAVSRTKNQVQADRARLLQVEQSVLGAAVGAYLDVVRDQAVVELTINNERVLSRQLEATQDRFRVGEVTRTDVAQAESRLKRASADRIQAEGNLTSSRAVYRNVVGDAPGKLEPAVEMPGLPQSERETIERATSDNYNVVSARFLEDVAKDRVREIVGEMLPQVSIDGVLDKSIESVSANSEIDTAAVTARVRVPLYQSGSVESRVREAKELRGQRRNELLQTLRQATQLASQTWQAYETARARIQALNAQIDASRIALEGVQQEALVGSRTVLDVLDAEQELLNGQVDLVRAQHDELVASYQLKSTVGDLTAEKLKLPVQLYDYTKHYEETRNKWFGIGISNDPEKIMDNAR